MPGVAITLADLVALLHTGVAHEELSGANGVSWVSVDLDQGPSELPESVVEALQRLVTVTVAYSHAENRARRTEWGPAEAFDVVLGAESSRGAVLPAGGIGDGVTAVTGAVDEHPIASVSLALLLRDTERRSITDGLIAESSVFSLLQAGPEFAAWRSGRPARAASGGHLEPDTVVRTTRDGTDLRITLARPHKHNAVSSRLRDQLAEALTLAVADDTIVSVVIDGDGRSFSSGGDLDEFGSFPDPASAHLIRLTRSPASLMARLQSRTTVRVHGACMGAGIELAAFAGRIVARPDAVIALPEIGLGLVPGSGGTVSLPRRIGRHRTAYLGLTGERIDATRALAWGLIDAVDAPS